MHSAETRLDLASEPNWEIPSSITAKSLTLVGCSTGAGVLGAELLSRLATRTQLEVRAPAGLVHIDNGCPDLFLGKNVVWQVAKPNEPAPIPIEQPQLFEPDFDQRNFVIVIEERFRVFDRASVKVARWRHTPASVYEARASDTDFARTWENDAARHSTFFIEFQEPQLAGHPAAFVTGLLELAFEGEGRTHHRRFRVFNDELIQDLTMPQVYYRANIPAMLAAMPA